MSIAFLRSPMSSLVALGLSCALASAPALASTDASMDDSAEAAQRLVRFGDLDLTTKAGQDSLHSRVLQAVDAVCTRPDPGDFGPMRDIYAQCRNTALVSARVQVRVAMANARGGKALASNDVKAAPKAP